MDSVIVIANWNSNGLKNKLGELISFLYRHKIDIAIITETKLTESIKIKIRNYSIYRQDRNIRGGGVAILIKNSIIHKNINNYLTTIEHTSIQLQDGTIISAAYSPPLN